MNTILRSVSLFLALLSIGCASTGQKLDVNKMMADYYAQERTYSAIRVTGAKEFVLRGENMEVALDAPLNPLSMRAADPNVALQTVETLGRVAVAGLGIYAAGDVMKTMARQPKTVDPVIVDRPVPFEVPAPVVP